MKLVINKCPGGFSLSPKGVSRFAELQGRPCFLFVHTGGCKYEPLPEDAPNMFFTAFDIPDPNGMDWGVDENWDRHNLTSRPKDRTDPMLVQVVEELGDEASGPCAELRVVEIPDGIDWEICEHNGNEHVAERHRTWR